MAGIRTDGNNVLPVKRLAVGRRVVIIGGGLAGVKAARTLVGDRRFNVMLISNSEFLTGTRLPLSQIFKKTRLNLCLDEVVNIEAKAKLVITKSGRKTRYDELIIAVGRQLQNSRTSSGKTQTVVGGGQTGVWQAAEMAEEGRQVTLFESSPRILPNLPERMARIAEKRLKKLGVALHLSTPVKNSASTASGPVALISSTPYLKTDSSGRVLVDVNLTCAAAIGAIGSCSNLRNAASSQSAIRQGDYYAKALITGLSGLPIKAYQPNTPPLTSVRVGRKWYVVMVRGIYLQGRAAWWAYRWSQFETMRQLLPLGLAIRAWRSSP